MGILLKNCTVVTASNMRRVDVLIDGEVITAMGIDLPANHHDVVDCADMYLLPGGIDVHTHLELPYDHIPTVSNDDFETGHIAAAFGGTTSHIGFVIQPQGGKLAEGLAVWRKKA